MLLDVHRLHCLPVNSLLDIEQDLVAELALLSLSPTARQGKGSAFNLTAVKYVTACYIETENHGMP